MNVIQCAQNSPEWFEVKCGRVSASRVAAVMAKLKDGSEASGRAKLRGQLIGERLSQSIKRNFVSASMEWGIENEPLARTEYELATGRDVKTVGFVLHPTIAWAGASPDGLVGDDGLIEIKCPDTDTHLDYFESDSAPKEYQPQMLWQMACTGRKWCDFVSYDPRLIDGLRLYIVRFERDEKRISEMEAAVSKFLAEVDEKLRRIAAKAGKTEESIIGAIRDNYRDGVTA